jgi:hypothetical protein
LDKLNLLSNRSVDLDKLIRMGLLTSNLELIESNFKALIASKPSSKVDLTDLESFVETYRSIFPKGVESAPGHPARGDKQGCIAKMKKFLVRYPEYSRETILEATKKYVNLKSHSNYHRIQTAHYFIEREGVSTLASICETIQSSPTTKLGGDGFERSL